jgi:3-methyladenine DNA glycosylase Mpg
VKKLRPMSKPRPQSFYERDALVVAEELLG